MGKSLAISASQRTLAVAVAIIAACTPVSEPTPATTTVYALCRATVALGMNDDGLFIWHHAYGVGESEVPEDRSFLLIEENVFPGWQKRVRDYVYKTRYGHWNILPEPNQENYEEIECEIYADYGLRDLAFDDWRVHLRRVGSQRERWSSDRPTHLEGNVFELPS